MCNCNTNLENVVNEITLERARQDKLFGSQLELEPDKLFIILSEEVGEVARAINDGNFSSSPKDNYREELVQVAAVAVLAIQAYDHQVAIQD